MNLQLYQQGNPPKYNNKLKETVYGPINNAEYNPFGFNRQNIISPFTGLPMSMINPNKYKTIAKQYKIDMSGLGSREIDTIFETKLPNDNYKYESIKNRLSLIILLGSNLVRRDGESVPLYGSGDTLLSHVKPVDFNPKEYGLDGTVIQGGHRDLSRISENMIIYKACYPIKYDRNSGRIECSSKSSGINIRIYDLGSELNDVNSIKEKLKKDFNNLINQANIKSIREDVDKLKNSLNDNVVNNNVINEIRNYEYFRIIF